MPRNVPLLDTELTAATADERSKIALVGEHLVKRLKARTTADGVSWFLDLRHRKFGNLGRITVHDPSSPGWPDVGQATSDRTTAARWVRERYAGWFYRTHVANRRPDLGALSTADACDLYLEILERELGSDHNTVKNRRSAARQHIKPTIGQKPFLSLDRETVKRFLLGLRVTVWQDGVRVMQPASPRTQDNVRAMLLAMWHELVPNASCPYLGITLSKRRELRQRREMIRRGDVEDLLRVRAFTPAAMLDVLAAAMWYDHDRYEQRPNFHGRFYANSAEVIACQIGTGMRIEELCYWRWRHVHLDRGYAIVPGTKTGNALRIIPIQDSLRPWLERLRVMQGEPRPNDFVIRIQCDDPAATPLPKTWIRRVSDIMLMSGSKIPRKATHACRSTHFTMGTSNWMLVDLQRLKYYLGHENPWGGATSDYVDMLVDTMPPGHRQYITLPTPEDVAQRLATFTPAEEWHARATQQRQRKAQREQRRAALNAMATGAGGTRAQRRSITAQHPSRPARDSAAGRLG